MNVLIIGAGGVGIGIAASLKSQGVHISIYAKGETVKAIKKNGIKRCGLFTHYEFEKIPVYENYSEIPRNTFDFIIISTKTTQNNDVANKLSKNRDILKKSSKIIIFQNGFGNDNPYLKYFKKSQVFCARLITGFIRHERYISEITSYTEPIYLGSLQGKNPECLSEIASLITKSGIKCELTDNIDKYLWAKMLYNCSLNPLGAILDKTYGELTKTQYTIDIMNNIIDEIFDVINASEYETLWEDSEEYKDIFYSKLIPDTYNHYSSTYYDVKRKIKTEIDSLNGSIIKLGEKYNIDTKTNKTIYNLIKTIESNF